MTAQQSALSTKTREAVAGSGLTEHGFRGQGSEQFDQRSFLEQHGVPVDINEDGRPVVADSDWMSALQLMFNAKRKPSGWHRYRTEYIDRGICTAEEFAVALSSGAGK